MGLTVFIHPLLIDTCTWMLSLAEIYLIRNDRYIMGLATYFKVMFFRDLCVETNHLFAVEKLMNYSQGWNPLPKSLELKCVYAFEEHTTSSLSRVTLSLKLITCRFYNINEWLFDTQPFPIQSLHRTVL